MWFRKFLLWDNLNIACQTFLLSRSSTPEHFVTDLQPASSSYAVSVTSDWLMRDWLAKVSRIWKAEWCQSHPLKCQRVNRLLWAFIVASVVVQGSAIYWRTFVRLLSGCSPSNLHYSFRIEFTNLCQRYYSMLQQLAHLAKPGRSVSFRLVHHGCAVYIFLLLRYVRCLITTFCPSLCPSEIIYFFS